MFAPKLETVAMEKMLGLRQRRIYLNLPSFMKHNPVCVFLVELFPLDSVNQIFSRSNVPLFEFTVVFLLHRAGPESIPNTERGCPWPYGQLNDKYDPEWRRQDQRSHMDCS